LSVPHRKEPPPVLQRAVALLARREHSRAELARKLARRQDDTSDPAEVKSALDRLEALGLLSDERFAAALVRHRSRRFGAARVVSELRRHQVDPGLIRRSVAALNPTELERAREAWTRKFGVLPRDSPERARQIRFLCGRGFAPEIVLSVIKDAAVEVSPN